jgi:putative flippase GtrA
MEKFFKSDLFRETATYLAVGLTATAASYILQFLFTTVFMLNYAVSSAVSFALTSPISFFLNRRFTFRAGGQRLWGAMARFYMIVILCFALSYFALEPALDLLLEWLALPWEAQYQTYAKQVAANAIYIAMNYLGQKFFAFKKKENAEQGDARDMPRS